VNQAGVSVLMVEQNVQRCLEIAHRAYVLDQGRNAYTGTGTELMHDENVIALYMGTLARSLQAETDEARGEDTPGPDA
jgi:branched-chain amino acid transport system ATP-binding protein